MLGKTVRYLALERFSLQQQRVERSWHLSRHCGLVESCGVEDHRRAIVTVKPLASRTNSTTSSSALTRRGANKPRQRLLSLRRYRFSYGTAAQTVFIWWTASSESGQNLFGVSSCQVNPIASSRVKPVIRRKAPFTRG
jgi:hypothetical protein